MERVDTNCREVNNVEKDAEMQEEAKMQWNQKVQGSRKQAEVRRTMEKWQDCERVSSVAELRRVRVQSKSEWAGDAAETAPKAQGGALEE